MMCGIDEAIQHIRRDCKAFIWAECVINRLAYHRAQAQGVKPKYHKGDCIKDWYTCGNCGRTVEINFDYCPKCGYQILWDSTRCLTGLPLVDMAEGRKQDDRRRPDQMDSR